VEQYIKYYDENRGYFWANKAASIILDEDVKSLGIPNNDKRLLDAAIKLLESGRDVEKGKRILSRYTLVDFATAKEWRNWYNKYQDKFFFSETGGWFFLINSREPGLNDYHANNKDETWRGGVQSSGGTSIQNPVMITTSVVTLENGNWEIFVKLKIHPGHYIYSHVADSDPYVVTKVNIEVPEGLFPVGDLRRPTAVPYNDKGTSIYKNEAVFSREIKGIGLMRVNATITYQCCDGDICHPPQTKKLVISAPLE
jgi:hypothetical protein